METTKEKPTAIATEQFETPTGENSALYDFLESLNQCTHE